MTAFTASAPGKIILAGEHAVVYGQPALAVPLPAVQARAVVRALLSDQEGPLRVIAPGIDLDSPLRELPPDHHLRAVVNAVLEELGIRQPPSLEIRISSTIPISSGLGSGAAVSVAASRALSAFLGKPLPDQKISEIAFEVEKIHHGTPSGIDNTVIAYQQPVFYAQGHKLETFTCPEAFTLVIGDTGHPSPTGRVVADVRQGWKDQPARYQAVFREIGDLVRTARSALEEGNLPQLGALLDENHRLLQQLEVSSPELDHLTQAAREAGAWGAKLSGGGRGGQMIALSPAGAAEEIAHQLESAGAAGTLTTCIRCT